MAAEAATQASQFLGTKEARSKRLSGPISEIRYPMVVWVAAFAAMTDWGAGAHAFAILVLPPM
jgi:hypothetical protein